MNNDINSGMVEGVISEIKEKREGYVEFIIENHKDDEINLIPCFMSCDYWKKLPLKQFEVGVKCRVVGHITSRNGSLMFAGGPITFIKEKEC